MVKLLFCGDIDGNWNLLIDRLNELQKSNHGPFDLLFIVGKFLSGSAQASETINLPLKTHAFDKSFSGLSVVNLEVFCDNGIGITTVAHNLTVGYLTSAVSESSAEYEAVRKITSNVGYRGCDVLITSDWPREMHHFLDDAELSNFKTLPIGIGSGTKAASSAALMMKPRYHFVAGKGCFYQRAPYRNTSTSTDDIGSCFAFTRLLSIDRVSASKDKARKWMHALAFSPIVNMSSKELAEEPAGTTECPYVTVGTTAVKPATLTADGRNAASKRPRTDIESAPGGGSGSFFFGTAGVPRGGNADLNLEAPSATCCTLFIGGLQRDLGDYELRAALPGATLVKRPPGKAFAFVEFGSHAAAKKVVEGAARHGLTVRGRTLTVGWGKEKQSHEARAAAAAGDGVYGPGAVFERELVPPTSDSKTLFVGGIPPAVAEPGAATPPAAAPVGDEDGNVSVVGAMDTSEDTPAAAATAPPAVSPVDQALLALFAGAVLVSRVPGKSYAFVEFDSYAAAMAVVTRSIAEPVALQGRPLTIGWAKGDVINSALNRQQTREILAAPPSEDSRVLFLGSVPVAATDADISEVFGADQGKIVSVRRPAGRDYAFVEFGSPADAQEAINHATAGEVVVHGAKLLIGWAKGRAADRSDQSADCWFCLASPVVKVHLVVSVGEHSYAALPRGGASEMHVLVAPIDCVPSRVHLSAEAKAELARYQERIERLHVAAGYTALRFERALRTKGSRDHMQVHLVPLAAHLVTAGRALSLFQQKAAGLQLKFHEITDSSRSIDEVVLTMEGGPYQEYFYIEVPATAATPAAPALYRRFVYVAEERSPRFPMQFGIELAAEVMGQPEKAHWKHCLLSEEAEHALADQFRDAFAPHDFTL